MPAWDERLGLEIAHEIGVNIDPLTFEYDMGLRGYFPTNEPSADFPWFGVYKRTDEKPTY